MKLDEPQSAGLNPWSWPPLGRCDVHGDSDEPWYLAWQTLQAVEMDADSY